MKCSTASLASPPPPHKIMKRSRAVRCRVEREKGIERSWSEMCYVEAGARSCNAQAGDDANRCHHIFAHFSHFLNEIRHQIVNYKQFTTKTLNLCWKYAQLRVFFTQIRIKHVDCSESKERAGGHKEKIWHAIYTLYTPNIHGIFGKLLAFNV